MVITKTIYRTNEPRVGYWDLQTGFFTATDPKGTASGRNPKEALDNLIAKHVHILTPHLCPGLFRKDVRGKRLCLKSKAGIRSDKHRANIADTGEYVAIQVGDLVFDNLNPDGIPLNDWLNDLGGPEFIQPSGNGAQIELFEEEFGSPSGCM